MGVSQKVAKNDRGGGFGLFSKPKVRSHVTTKDYSLGQAFFNKVAETQLEKTQGFQNSSKILRKNARYWNLFQNFNQNKQKNPK